ncbi:MAG: asparaginase [Clostridia bacterium]|nr:asparaginase [Clostridia bacterium]
MKRINLISTGGTIACVPTENGLAPGLSAKELLALVEGDHSEINCIDLFSMDSSNIQPEEWITIAEAVRAGVGTCDGVVLTHGTDTMAYTASMLSFMLAGIPIPVVLTGAQYPAVYPDSDGRRNLENALIAAQSLPGGVYICFGNSLMLGCRAVKTRTTSLNAFESINYPYIGTVSDGRMLTLYTPVLPSGFSFSTDIDPRVALVKLIPGMSPRMLDYCMECDIHGVVVEGFGLGGMHSIRRNHLEAIRRLMEKGIPVVLTSQCLYEQSSPDIYEVSRPLRDLGIISAGDMTTEAAITKLMWVLGRTNDMAVVRMLMQKNLVGELTEKF